MHGNQFTDDAQNPKQCTHSWPGVHMADLNIELSALLQISEHKLVAKNAQGIAQLRRVLQVLALNA